MNLAGNCIDLAVLRQEKLIAREKAIRRHPYVYVKGLAADAADLLREVFGDIMEMGTKPGHEKAP